MGLAVVIAAFLATAPVARARAAVRGGHSAPTTVTATLAISSVTGVALAMLGLGLAAATPVDGVFGLIGAGLCIAGIVAFRCLRGIRAGDVGARRLLSGAMVGYFVLLVLARSQATAAEALIVPIILAGAVIALLWFPPASRIHFAFPSTVHAAPQPAPQPVTVAEPTPPAPAPVPVPVPPVPVPQPARTAFHVVVGVVAGSTTAKSSSLQLVYEQQSWFPVPAPDEEVLGAYLVLMLAHGKGGPRDRYFEGTSSLVITDRRLAGVCPRGTGPHGALDSVAGPVIPWSVPRDELSEAIAAASQSGPYLALRVSVPEGARILLAKPRIAQDGGFLPVDIAQLARDLAPGRRWEAPAGGNGHATNGHTSGVIRSTGEGLGRRRP